ncbi:MAG: hypothetical protein ACOYCA_03320 [Eggerthellaceae bacterium]|jgi:DNA-binding Lrp family transcriptional regulator
MSEKHYLLGTDQQQEWMQEYPFAPRGIGFSEPGTVGLDAPELSAHNTCKSFYQNYPEVFNLKYISKKTGLKPEEIKKRLKRMYDERLIMLVMNPNVAIYGWGLYWWIVKLQDDVSPEFKKELSDWFQNKDDICTGFECADGGDFDFFCGNHMRVLDNLLSSVIGPWRDRPEIKFVHLLPVRRVIREGNVNQFDAKKDYRKFIWGEKEKKRLFEVQDKIDKDDFAIIDAINNTPSAGDMLDFDVIAKLSGLDAAQMKKDHVEVIDNRRLILPMIYLNPMKLGLKKTFFLVRLFQNTPSYRKAQIADEFAEIPEFMTVNEITDSFYDIHLGIYTDLVDGDALRKKIESYGEVEDVYQADIVRDYRRWVARMDDENGYWEECVMTDDFLQDRTVPGYTCPFSCSTDVPGVK